MIYYILLVAMVVLVLFAVELRDLLYAVLCLAGAGLILTVLFFLLKAPDIAITQAVAGAGISTVLFVIAISRTQRLEGK